jgi:beta-catenin-like protein 1
MLTKVPGLLSLFTHENTDIAIDAIELLQELTDEDILPEDADEATQ